MKNFMRILTHTDTHSHMPVAGGGLHLCVEVDILRPWSGYKVTPTIVLPHPVVFPIAVWPSLPLTAQGSFLRQILFLDGPL